LKQVLDVDTTGDELDALLGHGSQQRLTLLIDKRDFIEIDNASPVVVGSMVFFPASSQFANPQADQASLQNPFLSCGRFGSRYLQHVNLFRLARLAHLFTTAGRRRLCEKRELFHW